MGTKFEFVEKYKDCGLALPERKTALSAGYDLAAAEDIKLPPLNIKMENLKAASGYRMSFDLDELAKFTKETKIKPTLVSTGLKCQLEPNTYLELSVRSSTPLKYWIILANGVGRLL